MKKQITMALSVAMGLMLTVSPAMATEESAAEPVNAVTETAAITETGTVSVTGGLISGVVTEDGQIISYKGIPYAAPPVGELRWKAPQDVVPWDGVLECTEFGNSSYQGTESAFGNYSDEFLNSNRNYSEDSLTVNVWTKTEKSDELKPVILYIHGGGNTSGGSSCPIYDGEQMARKDIVYVSLNYRLAKFGFMASSELSAENEMGVSGNYAIQDMIKALEWIQDNITEFGGDPDNVTIIGQSAGAGNVGTLTISPLAEGLFNKAVGWSSLSVSNSAKTLEDLEETGDDLAESYGLSLDGLREAAAEEIQNMSGSFSTNVDGYVVTDTSLNVFLNGEENDVPTMTGMVNGDAAMSGIITSSFASYLGMNEEEYVEKVNGAFGDMAEEALEIYPANGDDSYGVAQTVNLEGAMYKFLTYAKVRATTATTPTFLYYYDHDYAGLEDQGAFHSSDIPYWLGGVFTEDKTFSDTDYMLADIMSSYISNFVSTGDVNGEGLPEWPAYDGTPGILKITNDGAEYVELNAVKANFWDEYYSKQLGIETAPVEVTEEDELSLAEEIAATNEAAGNIELLPIVNDDPENPTIQLEKEEGTTFTVAEWAAGAWNPVATTGMYPIKAYAMDAEGNIIGYLEVADGIGDYAEYAEAAAIGVMSSFTGYQAILDLTE